MFNISAKVLDFVETDKEKKSRFEAMKEILTNLGKINKPLIFKGGSALMFFYQLDRFSEDLDFDTLKNKENINNENIKEFNGLYVYSINAILEQKLIAYQYRTVARDLYDIAFILDTYFSKLSPNIKAKAKALLDNLDNLLDKYINSFLEDNLLTEADFDITEGRLKGVKNKLNNLQNRVSLKFLFDKKGSNPCLEP